MQEIKPPQEIPVTDKQKLFLAGSIEMGTAEDWQTLVAEQFKDLDIVIFNPRRLNWDSSWKQSIDNPPFKEQVEWELNALGASDHILMYFDPNTKSPISLLELGLFASSGKLVVVCMDGFWRRGNVDIVCERYGIPRFETIFSATEYLTEKLKK